MSEMIDMVAKAIALWDGSEWDGSIGGRECVRDRYRNMARAAIKAMDQWRFQAAGITSDVEQGK